MCYALWRSLCRSVEFFNILIYAYTFLWRDSYVYHLTCWGFKHTLSFFFVDFLLQPFFFMVFHGYTYLQYCTKVSTSTSCLDEVDFEELLFLKGNMYLQEEKMCQGDMEEEEEDLEDITLGSLTKKKKHNKYVSMPYRSMLLLQS